MVLLGFVFVLAPRTTSGILFELNGQSCNLIRYQIGQIIRERVRERFISPEKVKDIKQAESLDKRHETAT